MAFTTTNRRPLNAVRIVSRHDDAVDADKTDWEKYDADPISNAAAIVMKPGKEPTYFLCNFDLSGRESAMVKDAMVKGVDRSDGSVNLSYGKWAYTVARLTLKDIQNPPNVDGVIDYKKDGTGYVLDSVLSVLERAGVVGEIFNHYVTLTQGEATQNAKN
jgi:hypothetical protein